MLYMSIIRGYASDEYKDVKHHGCEGIAFVVRSSIRSMGSTVTPPLVSELAVRDPVLLRFRSALTGLYGNEIDRVVLFGSRARGDAGPDSDYDVAVFLKSLPDRWKELDRLADLRLAFLEEADVFFDAKPYLAAVYQERTPLMREIRRDGLDV
jgi:predicted nucleotidyltransferase